MQVPRPTLIAAGVLAVYGSVQAAIGASELAAAPPTTRLRAPMAALFAVAGFAVNVITYGTLGYVVAASGRSAGAAASSGALAGALAATATGAVNFVFFREQLRVYLASYGVAPDSTDALLVVGLVLGALFTAGMGALFAWLGAHFVRRRGAQA